MSNKVARILESDKPCLASIYCKTDDICKNKRLHGWELCRKHFGQWWLER